MKRYVGSAPILTLYKKVYSVFIMREFGPDELFLQGRIQVATAHAALSLTGLNSVAESKLSIFLDVHDRLTAAEAQKDLSIYLQGGETERTKADIIMSLELLEQTPSTQPADLEAARGLLSILKAK